MRTVSIVIPALNESENMRPVFDTIPFSQLEDKGWTVEVLVVDNGSTDGTAAIARELGARVIIQPVRGYGNAYKAGFANSTGSIIATGDADCTYPFDALPELLDHLVAEDIDFLSTDRLLKDNNDAMKKSHTIANHGLTAVSRALFRAPFRDSQSGMWIFRRHVWHNVDVRSGGMGFSQELKNEAFLKGFKVGEVPIEYRKRGGHVKLNSLRDGMMNTANLFLHRARRRTVDSVNVIDLRDDVLLRIPNESELLASAE